jgi:hypothetical protein
MSRSPIRGTAHWFSLCVGEEDPLPLLQTLYPSMSVLTSGNGKKRGKIRIRNTPLECMGKHFKKGLSEDYGVK